MSEFELSIIFPAFIACLLVLSTHVPLGMEVLRRGIIFIDLAIAQVAGLGVIAADTQQCYLASPFSSGAPTITVAIASGFTRRLKAS